MNFDMDTLSVLSNRKKDDSDSVFPKDPSLAMAYVPMQQLKNTYQPEQGWDNGTIFPELNKPFYGSRRELR